jgi:hypothetical protein
MIKAPGWSKPGERTEEKIKRRQGLQRLLND